MCCEPQTSLLACTQKQFASRADEITTSPICPQLSLTFRTQHCSDLRVVNRLLCVPVTSRHVRAVTARYSALGAMHLTQLRWSDLQPYTMSSVVPGTFVTRKYLHATPLQPVCLQPRAFQPAGSRCHCRRQSIAVRARYGICVRLAQWHSAVVTAACTARPYKISLAAAD